MITCGDCGAKEGQLHKDFCDMERCPICGGQFLYCSCVVKKKFSDRVPFISFPNICERCGEVDPEFFMDKLWKEVLPRIYWGKILCLDCWRYIKRLLGYDGPDTEEMLTERLRELFP